MSLIKTIRANCKDCYKCVRHCPMKAIRVVDGHAEIIDELCIGDGTCVRICPQGAKQVRDSREAVRAILASGKKVALSVAPSFVASFSDVDSGSFATAARRLGFDVVAETAEAAYYVTEQTMKALDRCERPAIASSCPVIVNLVERYYPHLLGHLVPVASPMVAHGRMLKEALGPDSKVVFVGPCIAKKREADREEATGAIDAVLTFAELSDLFEEAGIIPSSQKHSEWDGHVAGVARLFPVEGGMMATAGIPGSFMGGADLCITGVDQSIDFLEHATAHEDIRLVEMLSCEGGCIAGPFMRSDLDLWSRRRKIVEHAARGRAGSVAEPGLSAGEPGESRPPEPDMLSMSFHER
ncbi:MAG: [Fe-Fe] hydrogenase large subunit C-terminal domain-containing protein [Firmicutes bacterium]|nr:[Fe-Fe] hydrogenase large subunit C-terminal domain-containing protein [Bacillota bacterium]